MGFWAAAIPAIASIAGGIMGSKGAKSAQQQASKPQPYEEHTKRTPWDVGNPYIQDVLAQAQTLYNRAPWQQLPSGWNRMLTPEQASVQNPATGGGGGAGGGDGQNLNWRGKDRAAVQAARTQRQEDRYQRQQQSQQSGPASPSPVSPAGGAGPGAGGMAAVLNQQGPFGAPRQIQQDMYQLLQGGGSQPAQAGNAYTQKMLGGGVVNPFMQQLFDRISQWQPVGSRGPAAPSSAGPGWDR